MDVMMHQTRDPVTTLEKALPVIMNLPDHAGITAGDQDHTIFFNEYPKLST
jgi:hypothetical protein